MRAVDRAGLEAGLARVAAADRERAARFQQAVAVRIDVFGDDARVDAGDDVVSSAPWIVIVTSCVVPSTAVTVIVSSVARPSSLG